MSDLHTYIECPLCKKPVRPSKHICPLLKGEESEK